MIWSLFWHLNLQDLWGTCSTSVRAWDSTALFHLADGAVYQFQFRLFGIYTKIASNFVCRWGPPAQTLKVAPISCLYSKNPSWVLSSNFLSYYLVYVNCLCSLLQCAARRWWDPIWQLLFLSHWYVVDAVIALKFEFWNTVETSL